jgi:cytochrome c2
MGLYRHLAAASVVLPLSGLAMAQDNIDAGRDVFSNQCIACRAIACNRIGPRLQGVFGRTAGALPDYPNFSDDLKKSGLVWDVEKLDHFLADPRAMVPGTSMWAGKVDDAQRRRDVIAFLQQPDTSLDLCPQ